jgi:hypothetical protein
LQCVAIGIHNAATKRQCLPQPKTHQQGVSEILQLPQPLHVSRITENSSHHTTGTHRTSLGSSPNPTGETPIGYRRRRQQSTHAQSHSTTTLSTTGNGLSTGHRVTINTLTRHRNLPRHTAHGTAQQNLPIKHCSNTR